MKLKKKLILKNNKKKTIKKKITQHFFCWTGVNPAKSKLGENEKKNRRHLTANHRLTFTVLMDKT
jgi:hypothetical protein